MEKNKIKKQDIIKLIIIFTIIAILNEITFTNKPKTEKVKVINPASAELIVVTRPGVVVVKYGLIIAALVMAIGGLIYIQNKKK